MTADIELLPVAQCTNETALALADAPRSLRNYVAALQAEIEALRAEVVEWKRVAAAQAELHGESEERAERLAEALRYAVDNPDFDSERFDALARAALAKEHSHDNQ